MNHFQERKMFIYKDNVYVMVGRALKAFAAFAFSVSPRWKTVNDFNAFLALAQQAGHLQQHSANIFSFHKSGIIELIPELDANVINGRVWEPHSSSSFLFPRFFISKAKCTGNCWKKANLVISITVVME